MVIGRWTCRIPVNRVPGIGQDDALTLPQRGVDPPQRGMDPPATQIRVRHEIDVLIRRVAPRGVVAGGGNRAGDSARLCLGRVGGVVMTMAGLVPQMLRGAVES
jgi:hypothetical protein